MARKVGAALLQGACVRLEWEIVCDYFLAEANRWESMRIGWEPMGIDGNRWETIEKSGRERLGASGSD
jgi:hypothetical protein